MFEGNGGYVLAGASGIAIAYCAIGQWRLVKTGKLKPLAQRPNSRSTTFRVVLASLAAAGAFTSGVSAVRNFDAQSWPAATASAASAIALALVACVAAISGSRADSEESRKWRLPRSARPLLIFGALLCAALVIMAVAAAAKGDWFLAVVYLIGLLPATIGIWLSSRLRAT